jgi:hypothetical protein
MPPEVRVELQRPDGTTIRVVTPDELQEMSAAEVEGVVPIQFIVCACGRRNDLPRAGVLEAFVRSKVAPPPVRR